MSDTQTEYQKLINSVKNKNNPGISPIKLEDAGESKPKLKPETIASLEEVAKKESEKQSEPPSKETIASVTDVIEDLDLEEYSDKLYNLLQNKERRIAIESRCEPMDIGDLLLHQEVRQAVPIIPNKYCPTFRSIQGSEDLLIKNILSKDKGSPQYLIDKLSLMTVCAGTYSMNKNILPSHLNKDGDPEEDLFINKFKKFLKYPIDLLADLGVNYYWFQARVRKLLVIDNIKNF